MPVKKLSELDKANLIHDLAVSYDSQKALAAKYGITTSRISQFKQENQYQIDKIQAGLYDELTGDLIRQLDWRMQQLEQINAQMSKRNSPEFARVRVMAMHEAAEQLGQLPPRMQVMIMPVEHKIVGVDLNAAFGLEQPPAAIEAPSEAPVDAEVVSDEN